MNDMSIESVTYEHYPVSRVITVETLVSADYIVGPHVGRIPHVHKDAWEMIICLQNPVRILCGNEWKNVESGCLFFIRPGIMHVVDILMDDSRTFIISFSCSGGDNLFPLENTSLEANEQIFFLVERIRQEIENAFQLNSTSYLHLLSFHPAENSPVGAEQVICCCLEMILVTLLRNAIHKDGILPSTAGLQDSVRNYFVDQIEQYIRLHLNEPITVTSIAEHFHYSRSRLTTLYKKYTGRNLSDAIIDIRITQAKYNLISCRSSIALTAEKCGFCSPQYFSHVFKEKTGMMPSAYVKAHLEEAQNKKSEPKTKKDPQNLRFGQAKEEGDIQK